MLEKDKRALELIYDPDEYLCTWSVPDGEGGWRRLSGSVEVRANRPPRGQVYGDVPLRNSSTSPHESAFDFPQRTELPALRASLANGGTLILLDAAIEYWFPGSGIVTGSAALLGTGSGFFGRLTGVVDTSEQPVPRVKAAQVQIVALDAVLGTAPINRVVSNPAHPDTPKGQWTAYTNPDAAIEWTADGATLRVEYFGRLRVMDRYEFGLQFSPVATLQLTDGVTLRELIDDYVEPLRRIVAIATARSRDLTYLTVELEGEEGQFQVFGSGITQEPFESSSKRLRDMPSAVKAHGDGLSLLDMITRWRELASAHHPLVETYGSMLHAADQHPRSRFLLLIQALEGMHGAVTREEYEARAAKHSERRGAIIAKLVAMFDEPPTEALSEDDRQFIERFLMKGPMGGLDGALVAMAKALPVNGMKALGSTALVKGLRASGDAASTPEALRRVRNHLAHGERGYPVHDLDEAVAVLERIVRGHALRLLGCADPVVTRVFNAD